MLLQKRGRLRCATSLGSLGRSCLVHVDSLRLAARHPSNNGTVLKLITVQYTLPSASGGSRGAKKKANILYHSRSCGRVARHSRIREEALL